MISCPLSTFVNSFVNYYQPSLVDKVIIIINYYQPSLTIIVNNNHGVLSTLTIIISTNHVNWYQPW